MRKVKDSLRETGHLIQTYLSSEKLRALMKQRRVNRFVVEPDVFLALFFIVLVLIAVSVILRMW